MDPWTNDFIDAVIARRDLRQTGARDGHTFRVQPRGEPPAWYCDLSDDHTFSDEGPPSTYARWVCPSLARGHAFPKTPTPDLKMSRTGPTSDLGRMAAWVGRRTKLWSGDVPGGGWACVDPLGVLDADLHKRLMAWPDARYPDGQQRPAELGGVGVTSEGLIVSTGGWWGSAPALEHLIAIGIDIAHRLLMRRREALA